MCECDVALAYERPAFLMTSISRNVTAVNVQGAKQRNIAHSLRSERERDRLG